MTTALVSNEKSNGKARLIPATADTLNAWRHVEYDILRIIAGWGRQACEWEDKLAVCYHVWLQAEIVNGLRERLEMFPPHKPELPVAEKYEELANTVLVAPNFPSAMSAVHGQINPALARAYQYYLASSHPVHDKPTHDLLSYILDLKKKQFEWFVRFEASNSGCIGGQVEYSDAVNAGIATLKSFKEALPVAAKPARPAGLAVDFLMPETPGRVPHWNDAPNIMPILDLQFSRSVEARRLFFMIGYFWEMGVAESQLRWIYYADFMPWGFIYEEARHMWDESRHGNSGLSRLRDFGLDIKDIGYSSYGASGDGFLPPMTPTDVYNAFYSVTQVAERGFFKTKTHCFEDFAAGNDPASAEMMQYDIIDETMHAEYGRKWLTEMAARAGVDEDWLKRGAAEREARQQDADDRIASYRKLMEQSDIDVKVGDRAKIDVVPSGNVSTLSDPQAWDFYDKLIKILREQCPLSNAETAPIRPNLPM